MTEEGDIKGTRRRRASEGGCRTDGYFVLSRRPSKIAALRLPTAGRLAMTGFVWPEATTPAT